MSELLDETIARSAIYGMSPLGQDVLEYSTMATIIRDSKSERVHGSRQSMTDGH